MTVSGQPQVTYTYDNADRLTQIAQGTSTVGFSYDTVNRRSTLTLSNGVNMAYTYDNGSRVTGITYKFNSNTLGNLTYMYDSLGRRTQVGGSFAQTGLPGSVASATYDAANELTNWNGASISYDLNGNMLSDGTNAFSWNARNQVATLNSVSLQYDGFGRRTKNLQNTSFLFDGANAVQELSTSMPTANLISGGIDEIFARADSTGSFTPLTDALGSTIALVDASGNVSSSYAYEPFGGTTTSGQSSSNVFQYTGRENESNGLYFYRARYYSPKFHRFVSQDPLRLVGGINLYAYVADDPIGFVDPTGMDKNRPCSDMKPGWWPSWAPQGGGYVAGTTAVAGTGLRPSTGLGSIVTASSGIGLYSCDGWAQPWLQGGSATYQVNPEGVNETCAGMPAQTQTCDIFHTGAAGAYVGAGHGAYFTNASSLAQQLGAFQTTQINAWLFSVEYSEGNGIWVMSFTGGPGAGLSIHQLTTYTDTFVSH